MSAELSSGVSWKIRQIPFESDEHELNTIMKMFLNENAQQSGTHNNSGSPAADNNSNYVLYSRSTTALRLSIHPLVLVLLHFTSSESLLNWIQLS